ncbi:hypothetical protein [Rhodovulum steppense]|uniref:Uncharacterized protein n=1 Tax=Rhodovulum steppense TaxID=540251 RepID=A0A4R1YSN1_9RHOB|nr:hypothetical protein [Rhodovulum steppense]TCM82650.1 hypothetical protein EV216_11513 [Rhodovulum steppense]
MPSSTGTPSRPFLAGISLAAALLAGGTLRAEGLPERLIVGPRAYHGPGDGALAFVSSLPGYQDTGRDSVPTEVAALGLTAGARANRSTLNFGWWPFLVLRDGWPVAVVSDRDSGLAPDLFPESAMQGGTQEDPEVTHLAYRRTGDRITVEGRRFLSRKAMIEHGGMRFPGHALEEVTGEIGSGPQEGCFRLRTETTRLIYREGMTQPVAHHRDNQPFANLTVCLSIVETSELPDGVQAHRLLARMSGEKGLTPRRASDHDEQQWQGYLIGFSPAVAETIPGDGHLVARGDADFRGREIVARVNRFAAEIERSIETHRFVLAEGQIVSLNALLADLDAAGIAWHWARRPTAAGVERYRALVEATELYRLAHLDTQARVNDVRQQLEILRTTFSGNVVKAMLRSAIDWMNIVPTDPLSGLSGYSDLSGGLLLPQTLMAWRENAARDGSILASQIAAIRQFEALEAALETRMDEIVAARRALFERIHANDEKRALVLDAALRAR